MTSFRATFGLTRSIGGWEEGERRERNKQKRQPGRTGAGQRRERQLNEQREEINLDGEGREENTDVEEREKEREPRGSNLRRQRLASPTAQVLVAQTTQPVQKNRLRDELRDPSLGILLVGQLFVLPRILKISFLSI